MNELDAAVREIKYFADELGDVKSPEISLTPKEVVELQLLALSDEDRNRGIIQCMCFASPDNLVVTGPLEKFARIVRGEKFAALSDFDAYLIGDSIFKDENARVLVTVLADDQIHAFVWVLAKQTMQPYENCWMTDGVFPVETEDDWSPDEI